MSFHWTDGEVREALGLDTTAGAESMAYEGVSTDSRTVGPGDLFLALRGERFDGHDFVFQAVQRGAAGLVLEEVGDVSMGSNLYRVPDTLEALGSLARHRRKALTGKVVGITGSSGKTSTKDLLVGILRGGPRFHATPGNLNNRIGLPLTLLSAPDDAEVLVLEMGTNEPGEIRALTGVAEPDIGVITTVSETHLEKLGSLEGVLEEKLDLFRGLQVQGLGVVGDEPPVLEERARETCSHLLVTGWSERVGPENRPESPRMLENGSFAFIWRGEPVELGMPGRHSVQNALLALAVADALGIPARQAAERIGAVRAGGMRSEVRNLGSLVLVVDCYNANPQSLRAAVDLLTSLEAPGPRVAVLGSMLELGEDSEILHDRSLAYAMNAPLDLVIATGLFADSARRAGEMGGKTKLVIAPGLDEARDALLQSLGGDEVVLLKASRGVAMETLIPSLEDRFGPGRAA